MPYVDLAFRLTGNSVPVDHGYALYAALSRIVPEIHDAKEISVPSIRGVYGGEGSLRLADYSRLVIRLPDEQIRSYLKLAGKRLEIDGCLIGVGVPEVRALQLAAQLRARLVTIKGFMDELTFRQAAQRQLDDLKIAGELLIGERHTLRVKDKQVVGFEVAVSGLTAEGVPGVTRAWIGWPAADGVWGVCTRGWVYMMGFRRLLAKSSKTPLTPRGEETLPGHTASVLAAARTLLEETADAQLTTVGLAPTIWRERLYLSTLVAAFCHDLGKANNQFQAMVRRELQTKQAIRHEALSLLIVYETVLYEWLLGNLENAGTLDLVLWAASGHHRKFPPPNPALGTGTSLSLMLGHSDFHRTLMVGAKLLNLSDPPELNDRHWQLTGPNSPTQCLLKLRRSAAAFWDNCTDEQRRFLAAVKACIIAADVAGSALPKEGKKIGFWIKEAIQRRPAPGQLEKIAVERLQGLPPRRFQEALGHTQVRVVLAQAGCGSGKTIGAYLWAVRRFPNKRLFFCYPTTGTATEGFRDYLIDPTLDAQLIHGRAAVDLDLLGIDDEEEPTDPLAALNVWSTLITSCTVDTVLGLTQNHRRGLYTWPALVNAAYVFDEIHAYDERLFAALLRFLHSCRGLPCLLMTASLPKSRRIAIEKTLSSLDETLEVVSGPTTLEALPRYQRVLNDDPWSVVARSLDASGKVLWVANTVDRALSFADEAEARGYTPLVYHSRFRYEDRIRQHGQVIEAFRTHGPVLAITTQVAEMSLDLSADLLVTDLAPIAALIQRLGRLNRRSTPDDPEPPKPFLVIEPDTEAPYKDAEHPAPFAAPRAWLERLGTLALSQSDLAQGWVALDEGKKIERLESAWLDGGFETTPRHLRESSSGLNVLLESDVLAVEQGQLDPVRAVIPMNPPKAKGWQGWRQVAYARVPPSACIIYNPERGARWKH